MTKILGREPAVFFAFVASLLQASSLLFSLSTEWQGVVNAVIVALGGFATAKMVSVDAVLPALTGLLKAVFALLLSFGWHLSDNVQVGILTLVTAAGAFVVRQHVEAKEPPKPSRRPVACPCPLATGQAVAAV
jgi:hypothetical protein